MSVGKKDFVSGLFFAENIFYFQSSFVLPSILGRALVEVGVVVDDLDRLFDHLVDALSVASRAATFGDFAAVDDGV